MSKPAGCNYVETQKDADFLLEETFCFHDTILKELNYISGGYVGADNAMRVVNVIRKVTMLFDSQWCDSIEMIFEGVTLKA
jgi:hypothetical protein